MLIVSRFPHRPIPVNARNVARLAPQFDLAVSRALGTRVRSSVATVAGRPALVYPPAAVTGLPTRAFSRIVDVFVADDEYELNCQYRPALASSMTAACNEMLATLKVAR